MIEVNLFIFYKWMFFICILGILGNIYLFGFDIIGGIRDRFLLGLVFIGRKISIIAFRFCGLIVIVLVVIVIRVVFIFSV